MVQRSRPGGRSGFVAGGVLAIAARVESSLEDLTPCVESRQPIGAIAGHALRYRVQAVCDEDNVDADDVGKLTRLLAIGSTPAQYPSHYPKRAFLAQQRNRLWGTEPLIRQRDGSLGLGIQASG